MTIDSLIDLNTDIKPMAEFPIDDKLPINYAPEDLNRIAGTYASAKQLTNSTGELKLGDIDIAKSELANNGIKNLRNEIDLNYRMMGDSYLTQELNRAVSDGRTNDALDIIDKGKSLNIPDPYALETHGVNNLAMFASIENTGTPDNTVSKNVTDYLIKREILNNELSRIKAEENISAQESGILNLVNYAAMLVPFNKQTMVADGVDTLTPGTKLLKDYASVMNTPLENGQFVSALRGKIEDWRKHSGLIHGENLPLVASQLQDWVNYDSSNKFADNVWSIVDAATLLPIGIGGKGAAIVTKAGVEAMPIAERAAMSNLVRVDNSALGTLRQVGSNKLATKAVTDTVLSGQPNVVVRSEDEALRASLPFRTEGTPTDSLATNVTDEVVRRQLEQGTITRQQALNDALIAHNPTSTLTDEELKTAIDNNVAIFMQDRQITNMPIVSIDVDPITLAPRTNMDFFGPAGKSFENEISATEYASNVGIKNYKLVGTPDKGFAIRVENIVDTGEYVTALKLPNTEELGATVRSGMRRWLQQPRGNVPAQTQAAATEAITENSAIRSTIGKIYNRDLKPLSIESQRKLAVIANEVRDVEQWGDVRAIQDMYQTKFGTQMSTKEINAWNAYVDINDLDWHMANSSLYKTMASKGFISARLAGQEVDNIIGKKISAYMDLKAPLVFDTEANTYRRIASEEFDVYKSRGMQFFEVHDGIKVQGQRPLYIMGKPGMLDFEALPKTVLPYKEGGRVQYATGSVFLKQDAKHVLRVGEDKVEFAGNPKTLYVEKNLTKARSKIERFNNSLRSYKDMDKALKNGKATEEMLTQTNKDISLAGRYSSFKQMQQAIKSGEINLEPLRLYTNRSSVPLTIRDGKLALDTEAQSGLRLGDSDPRIQSLFGDMRGKMAPRGMRKLSTDEVPAELKSPFETVEEALSQSINSYTLAEFKITEPLRWLKTYQPYLEGFTKMDSPVDILQKGQFKSGTPWAIVNQGEQLRTYIKNILKLRTKQQAADEIDMLNRQLRIEGSLGDSEVLKNISQKWMDFKAGDFFRTLNYHATLGMFNPTQFLLQSTSALYSFSLKTFEPILALKSMKSYLLLNRMMIRGKLEDVVYMNQLGRQVDKTLPSIKAMYDDMIHSGFLDINGTHTLRDTALAAPELFSAVDDSLAKSYLRKAQMVGSKALQGSSIFFTAGERQGRIAAWAIAYNDAIDKGILKANMSTISRQRGITWVKNEADRLSFGQTKANQMWLQLSDGNFLNNYKSVMFQYWQFAMKLLDAQTTSKAYTVKEKLGSLLTSSILLGSSTVPFGSTIKRSFYDYLFSNKQTDMTWDQFDTMTKGSLDAAISAATGEDVRFGENVTVGGMIQNNIVKMVSGDISPLEVLGGAAYDRAKRIVKEFVVGQKMYDNVNGRPVSNISERTVNILAAAISSVNLAKRSYEQIETGKIFAKDGTPLIEISPKAVLLNAGGITTGHYQKVYSQIELSKSLGKEQKDAVTIGTKLYSQYMQALAAGHYDDAEAFSDAYNVHLQAYPLSLRRSLDKQIKENLRSNDSFIRTQQYLQQQLLNKRVTTQNQNLTGK